MTTVSKTHCDNCKHDLSDGGSWSRYRLILDCEEVPSTSNVQFDVLIHPPLTGRKHFCGTKCLEVWLQRGEQ